jgi:hypothetical protein
MVSDNSEVERILDEVLERDELGKEVSIDSEYSGGHRHPIAAHDSSVFALSVRPSATLTRLVRQVSHGFH